MAKPKSKPQLSLDSAHNSDRAAGIPPDYWCHRFFEHIYCSFDDAQFADLYEEGGRYPISPALLACITILQFMEKVSDRIAVLNTIMRRDWRIALGRDDAWEGFDASVLCNFRKRLVEHGWERRIFDHVIEQLEALGLLGGHRKVRVDSTKLVANVARLSRAEVISETLRVAVCELWDNYPELHQRPDLVRLYDDYGEERWLGRSSEGDERLTRLGRDGYMLLELFDEIEQPHERTVQCRELLQRVLEEHFAIDEDDEDGGDDGDLRALEGKELKKGRLVSPHEPDVKLGTKGGNRWIGDKVHFVETADGELPNFVIDLLVTDPTVPDVKMLTQIIERARFRTPEVDTVIADSGYASGQTSREADERGVELVSPPLANTSTRDIYPTERFHIDFANQTATCPAGKTTTKWYVRGTTILIRFDKAVCAQCRLRANCTTATTTGRTLTISRDYEQLMADRARAQTERFKALYRLRGAVEATISEAVHCCGLRRSRYRGEAKRTLHALFAATALNVRRFLRAALPAGGFDAGGNPCAASGVLCTLTAACGRARRANWRLRLTEVFHRLIARFTTYPILAVTKPHAAV